MSETWKPIKGYEGLYEVSNTGRIKSLITNKYLSPRYSPKGYAAVALYLKKKRQDVRIHHLVWDHFGDNLRNGMIRQIDHIDGNKRNNNLDNLRIVSNRENTTYYHRKNKELPTGVSYHKIKHKYRARIWVKGRNVFLGYYNNPRLASQAYQNKLSEIVLAKEVTEK